MSIRLVHRTDDVLVMEAAYGEENRMPPEHLHPRQAERFEVLEGAMRTIVDGVERVYRAGESFEVPVATPHQMVAEGPARMRWEVRPALRTWEFFERLQSGTGGASLLTDFADEIRLTGR